MTFADPADGGSGSASDAHYRSGQLPLFVDLDGTLVQTDTTIECLRLIRGRPLRLARALLAWPMSRAAIKQRVAAAVTPEPARLHYNEELLSSLRAQAASGRSLILATGADQKIAHAVADHLGLFDAVLASDGEINLTGAAKLAAIRRMTGCRPFVYAGNERKDLKIWCAADSAIVVCAPRSVQRAAAKLTRIEMQIGRRPTRLNRLLDFLLPDRGTRVPAYRAAAPRPPTGRRD